MIALRYTKKMSVLTQGTAVLLVIALTLVILQLSIGSAAVNPSDHTPVVVNIPNGATTQQIASILSEHGLIRDSLYFRLWVKRKGLDGRLQAGEYELNRAMNLNEIAGKMARGEVIRLTFTIPEGFRVVEIARLVADKGLVDYNEFLRAARENPLNKEFLPPGEKLPEPMEGYLFPDTYQVGPHPTARQLIEIMYSRFKTVAGPLLENAGRVNLTPHQVITLASIIEREAKVPEERALISAVYHNRLRIGMKLDADPTVRYALGKFTDPLTYKDLEVASPFNTYRNPGLPPGPIACPGRASIEAALNPASVDYLYFVARNDGTHVFSKTFEEHERNRIAIQGGNR